MSLQISRYITESPEKNYTQYKRKETLYKVLEKVTYVALLVILACVFISAYPALGVATAVSPWTIGLVLTCPLIAKAIPKIRLAIHKYSCLAKAEQKMMHELIKIAGWGSSQIESFFEKEGVDLANIDLNTWKKINPREPYQAIKPLIARYRSLMKEMDAQFQEALQISSQIEEKFYEANRKGKPVEQSLKERIRYAGHKEEYNKIRNVAIPALFNAALILLIIHAPNNTNVEIDNFPGKFNPQPFEAWMHEELFRARILEDKTKVAKKGAEQEDNETRRGTIVEFEPPREFFSFPPEWKKKGLTYQEISLHLGRCSAEGIRQIIAGR